MARDTANESSDVDIPVSFDGLATSKRYFGVQFYLEDLIGRPVNLVTDKSLRSELRPDIESISKSDKPQREWKFYIKDMIEFGKKSLSYTKGKDHANRQLVF